MEFNTNLMFMNCSGKYILGNYQEELGPYDFNNKPMPFNWPVALNREEYAFGTCDINKTKHFENVVYKLRPNIPAYKRARTSLKGKPMNIIMLVFDSLSRRMFFRRFPKTLNYLNNKLPDEYSMFDFKLNNVMGRNSEMFFNPTLFGDIKMERKNNQAGDFHTENAIWTHLHKTGFVSLIGADGCNDPVSIFWGRNPKVDHIMGSL